MGGAGGDQGERLGRSYSIEIGVCVHRMYTSLSQFTAEREQYKTESSMKKLLTLVPLRFRQIVFKRRRTNISTFFIIS